MLSESSQFGACFSHSNFFREELEDSMRKTHLPVIDTTPVFTIYQAPHHGTRYTTANTIQVNDKQYNIIRILYFPPYLFYIFRASKILG